MAHEIFAVKLCELEEQLVRMNSRIHLSETGSCAELQEEIKALSRECAEMELNLRKRLREKKLRKPWRRKRFFWQSMLWILSCRP